MMSNTRNFKEILENKRILITGGTGSFGKWITKRILKNNPEKIIIFSRDEEKQLDMDREFNDKRIMYVIGDIKNYDRVKEVMNNVDIVYHAAALKIVPVCEENTFEAIQTNILGTKNVKTAIIENNIDTAILISTDKAVKPINLYGMTKAIAEKEWLNSIPGCNTKFLVVRYGNVIGSRGSIIPFFRQLIAKKEELPITHENMTRFILSLDDAINLVFYATKNSNGGEIFVPKIPACKIVDLAKAMTNESYPLKIIGIRPGEKINECLIQEDEYRRLEEKDHIYVIHSYGEYNSNIIQKEFTSDNAYQLNINEIKTILKNNNWG